jgi:putative MATE family efflux protein
MLSALYNLVDLFWLGKVGKTAVAAPGVCMPLLFLVISLGMGLGGGGTALVAQYTGAGSYKEADRAAAQTLLLLCALAVSLAGPIMIFAPPLLRLFQVPAEVLPEARTYLRIVMLGLPFMAFAIGYGAMLRALGDTITVVVITAVANVVNLVLDPVLIFGLLGMPRLEVAGAALVTLISHVIAALACLWCLHRRRAGLHIGLADLKPDPAMLRKTCRVGLPLAIASGSNSFGFAVFQAMINKLGTVVIAAMGIGFRLVWFLAIPAHCMAMAAAPVVGQALGAGKVKLARRAVWSSVAIVALTTLPLFGGLMVGGRFVAAAFINKADVVAETTRFFLIVPASSYFFGVLMVLMAAFYGSGHTRPAMVLAIVRLWLLRLPAAYVLGFVVGWGSAGVYLGMVIGNVICALTALWLFFAGGWEAAVVPTGRAEPPAVAKHQTGETCANGQA